VQKSQEKRVQRVKSVSDGSKTVTVSSLLVQSTVLSNSLTLYLNLLD
jgi:hypothetical protein